MTAAAEARQTLDVEILIAARKLVAEQGSSFTTQQLIQEADVSLHTFYRYFNGGKDHLLLALIEAMIAEHCENLVVLGADLEDPVERFKLYIRETVAPLASPEMRVGAQFVTSEHWRLHERYPREIWAATAPVTDLLTAVITEASDDGQLSTDDPRRDAWFITKTVLAAYHHHAFVPDDKGMETLSDDLWHFCLTAAGGRPNA